MNDETRANKDKLSHWAFLVSLVAVAVSLVSVIFTGLQWRDARNQLIYATKPLLLFDVEEDPKDPPIKIVIENNGAGPAIIKSLTYYIDGKPIGNWEKVENYIKIDDKNFIHYELDEDYPIGAGGKIPLITYKKFGKENPQEVERLVDFLDQHLGVKLYYCSWRNDCTSMCSTKHMCGD